MSRKKAALVAALAVSAVVDADAAVRSDNPAFAICGMLVAWFCAYQALVRAIPKI